MNRPSQRNGLVAAIGSALVAIAASACCWLPLLLVTLGAGAVGVSAFFAAWRPWLLGASVVMLGVGFYFAYLRKEKCAPGSACETRPVVGRCAQRVTLWMATAFVFASMFFPATISSLVAHHAPAVTADAHTPADATARVVSMRITGMTCGECAVAVRGALRRVPSVRAAQVDYHTARATVTISRNAGTGGDPVQDLVEAVRRAGYGAEPTRHDP